MLKGVCEIELRDENGNVVQKTKDKNMVTDALNRILNPDLDLIKTRFGVPGSEMIEYLSRKLPILDGLIGGIVLFNEIQQEDINNVLYKSTSQVVGSGSVMVETVPDDNRIGVFNKEESDVIKDENKNDIGIKFVWDFATNQSNGTIRSVSLTTGIAGRSNYKNNLIMAFLSEGLNILYPLRFLGGDSSSIPHDGSFLTSNCKCLYLTQFKENEAVIITDTSEIKRIKLKERIGLADGLNTLSLQNGDIIKTASIKGLFTNTVLNNNYPNYFTNCDDKLYFCEINKKVLTVVEFNPETLESTSKNINLSQILTHDRTHPVAVYNNCYAIPDGITNDDTIRFVSMNDYTLVKSITLGNSYNITYGQYADYFVINNEDSRGSDRYFMIDKNFDIVISNSSQFRSIMPVRNDFIKDPFFMIRSTKGYSSGDNRNYGIAINPHIKFTIDNLATPVTKTASQTMKVIYTIQDAPEE